MVMVLTLGLVMAAPAAAVEGLAEVNITVAPPTATVAAEYTIDFYVHTGLTNDYNCFVMEFPTGTTVPASIATGDVKIYDITVDPGAVNPQTPSTVVVDSPTQPGMVKLVRVYMPLGTGVGIGAFHYGRVVFKDTAGLKNPSTPDTYCAWVYTDEEPAPVQDCYDIMEYPITLWLKWQAPISACGFIYYEPIRSFDTIQEALDYADGLWLDGIWKCYTECPAIEKAMCIGAKITVPAGTYGETIVIDTPGLELVSDDGAATTIIDATGIDPQGLDNQIAAVQITAGCVTFDGFTVKNAGVDVDADGDWADVDSNDYADARGIFVSPNISEKSLEYIYDAQGTTSYQCYEGRVNILNNIVYGSQAEGIQAENACVLVNGNEVYDNLWDGFVGTGLLPGVECLDPIALTDGTNACSEITNNEFYGNGPSNMGTGLDVVDDSTDTGWTDAGIEIVSAIGTDTLYIVGNNIHDNAHAGIYLGDAATNDTVVIKFNQIKDNGVFGISTKADNPGMIACVYNNIEGNTAWGIKNWETDDGYLVATLNWWGDLSGPSDGVAPLHPSEDNPDQTAEPPAQGIGDAVSHYVIYQWWLTYSFEDVQTDLIRYYGSDRYQGEGNNQFDVPWTPIVELEQGWNTLSTPVALDERADQMGEIVALGGWMKNFVLGYSYDPASGWQLLTANFKLLPLKAVYVKMSGPDMLPILLRDTNWMPARDLAAGWNLVSLNAGFWSQETSSMDVATALSSIAGSWSNAISPSMPGQQDSWVCTPGTAGSYDMYIGDGYWVFITKPTTLAGFCMAPWYLDDWEMAILNCQLPPWMMGP